MAYREIFNKEEWETLELSIIWMFQAIAGADKNIDTQELKALTTLKEKTDNFESDLLKEVLSSFNFDVSEISDVYSIDQRELRTGLRELAFILENRIDIKESLMFKKSLLALGMYIAFASGDILLSKMSDHELQLLIELALFMKLPISDYRKSPTVLELMEKLI
ncbi:hypothetical protein ACFLSQ_08620 [Bacteroidota bacterium]